MKGNAIPAENKLSLDHCAGIIQYLSTFCNYCYTVCQIPHKIAAKIAKNTRFEIPPFTLPPIWHYGEKFNIGAQLHLFRYRMASKVCVNVQALW